MQPWHAYVATVGICIVLAFVFGNSPYFAVAQGAGAGVTLGLVPYFIVKQAI